MTFGAFVRERRLQCGLSQSQLAEKTEVHATYISHLEHDRRDPSVLLLVMLGSALDVSPGDLFERLINSSRNLERLRTKEPGHDS